MPRLLFEKTGNAVWISHLDLMRLFQRAFKRSNLPLKHTQGFNPRPSVSIALPLSVGMESVCELLDFELDGEPVSCGDICERLNQHLVSGVTVRDVYDNGRKLRELSLLKCTVMLEYDRGVPRGAAEAIRELFSRSTLLVPKKTKNGVQEQDIIPMIHALSVAEHNGNTLELEAMVCCQNPSLNPMQLSAAVALNLPEFKPDFSRCRRIELFDQKNVIFR